MSATQPQPATAGRFLPWMRQCRLDDWRNLLAQATPDIEAMACDAGIDWPTLSQRLPACGALLKSRQVPVLDVRDQGRCAFVWHLNTDRYGNHWPCLVFMSFRQGGVHQIFHGYRWAWLTFRAGGRPLAAPARDEYQARLETAAVQAARAAREAHEAEHHLQRFRAQGRCWHAASPATVDHPLLLKRLCGQVSTELLSRLQLRSFEHPRGAGLMVRLQNHQHGHCGFQLLHPSPLDASGRTQHLVIRQRGMKHGSFVCIRAMPGHESWPVAICEGVFTALSVALGWPGPIAVALDAGNLASVRPMIGRNCVFFADNDAWGSRNTGLLRARLALQAGDRLVLPRFAGEFTAERPTDFNDLLRLAGPAELLRQVRQGWPER